MMSRAMNMTVTLIGKAIHNNNLSESMYPRSIDSFSPVAWRAKRGKSASVKLEGMILSALMNLYAVEYIPNTESPLRGPRMNTSPRKNRFASKLFNMRGYDSKNIQRTRCESHSHL